MAQKPDKQFCCAEATKVLQMVFASGIESVFVETKYNSDYRLHIQAKGNRASMTLMPVDLPFMEYPAYGAEPIRIGSFQVHDLQKDNPFSNKVFEAIEQINRSKGFLYLHAKLPNGDSVRSHRGVDIVQTSRQDSKSWLGRKFGWKKQEIVASQTL